MINILKNNMENEIWGMPCVIDHNNKRIYLKCGSAITAMGIGALVEKYYPGYKGHLVSLNRLSEIRDSLETVQ
jgi:hypothetical protein